MGAAHIRTLARMLGTVPRLVTIALLAAACGVVEPPTRFIVELNVLVERAAPDGDAVDSEMALAALGRWMRDADVVMGRRPDLVEFSSGRCPQREPCSLDRWPQPREVWLIEWTPDSNPDVYGLFLIDAETADVITGWTHGAERHEREEPLERRRRVEEAPGPGAGDAH
jgi:hypothetical protein